MQKKGQQTVNDMNKESTHRLVSKDRVKEKSAGSKCDKQGMVLTF